MFYPRYAFIQLATQVCGLDAPVVNSRDGMTRQGSLLDSPTRCKMTVLKLAEQSGHKKSKANHMRPKQCKISWLENARGSKSRKATLDLALVLGLGVAGWAAAGAQLW